MSVFFVFLSVFLCFVSDRCVSLISAFFGFFVFLHVFFLEGALLVFFQAAIDGFVKCLLHKSRLLQGRTSFRVGTRLKVANCLAAFLMLLPFRMLQWPRPAS